MRAPLRSDVQRHLHASFLEPALQSGELAGELLQLVALEFREDEFVQRFLLRGEAGEDVFGVFLKDYAPTAW